MQELKLQHHASLRTNVGIRPIVWLQAVRAHLAGGLGFKLYPRM